MCYMHRHQKKSGKSLFAPDNVLRMHECLVDLFAKLDVASPDDLRQIKVALFSDPVVTFKVEVGINDFKFAALQALLHHQVNMSDALMSL